MSRARGLALALTALCATMGWLAARVAADESFFEAAVVAPLPDGHTLVQLSFEMTRDQTDTRHYDLYPRTAGELVHKFQLDGLAVSLASGRWRSRTWGTPSAFRVPPSGLALWFNASEPAADSLANWRGLVHALSGVLGFTPSGGLADELPAHAVWTPLAPDGRSIGGRMAMVAREFACTENLTPWLKLLPSRTRGLAKLADGRAFTAASFFSLELEIRAHAVRICLTAVSPPTPIDRATERSLDSLWGPVNRAARGPAHVSGRLFERAPYARTSRVTLDGALAPRAEWDPARHARVLVRPARAHAAASSDFERAAVVHERLATRAVWCLERLTPGHALALVWQPPYNGTARAPERQELALAELEVHRTVRGLGLHFGTLALTLRNGRDRALRVAIHQAVPAQLFALGHTLRAQRVGEESVQVPIDALRVTRSRSGVAAWVGELVLKVPARAAIEVLVEFERVFLPISAHPPDANHGVIVPPAVVTVLGPADGDDAAAGWRVLSEPALVPMPTPDFSMPYNVITFVSTVLAIFFGSTVRLLLANDA